MIIRLHKFAVTHARVTDMPYMVAGGCDNWGERERAPH